MFTGSAESTDGDLNGKAAGFDACVLKFDKDGNVLWQKTDGGTSSDGVTAITVATDGELA